MIFGRIDTAEKQRGANNPRPLAPEDAPLHPGYESRYYDGEDRARQVGVIWDMAANISFASDDAATPVVERVAWFLENEPDLPAWFDGHDRELLARFVSEIED